MIFAIIGIIYAAHVGLLSWKLKGAEKERNWARLDAGTSNAACRLLRDECDTLQQALSALQEQHRQEQENAKQRNSERVRKAWKTRRTAA